MHINILKPLIEINIIKPMHYRSSKICFFILANVLQEGKNVAFFIANEMCSTTFGSF